MCLGIFKGFLGTHFKGYLPGVPSQFHWLKSPLRKCTWWFKVTFSSPSWRSLNHWKGSLNHPKKVTIAELPGMHLFRAWNFFTTFSHPVEFLLSSRFFQPLPRLAHRMAPKGSKMAWTLEICSISVYIICMWICKCICIDVYVYIWYIICIQNFRYM